MTNRIEIIEKYLNDELVGEELTDFINRMKTDATFNAEVESTRLMLNELNAFGKRKVLKNKLEEIHQEMKRNEAKPKRFNLNTYFKTISIAASVALVTSLITFISVNIWNASNQEQSYYRELRMDVDKMKQNHNKMWKSIYADRKIVNQGSFSGTGFVLSSSGYLATSYHLVKNADSIFIENNTFLRSQVKTVLIDKTLDIAILKVIDNDFKSFGKLPYGFTVKNKQLGDRIFTLGFPREEIVYGEGYISSGTGFEGDTNAYQVSIPVNPGNSGGPIFDDNGNVIGLVTGKHSINEGTAFALKTLYLKHIISNLEKDSSDIHIPIKPKINKLNNSVMINKCQDLIFRVKVYK